jgi:hypothetical protein
LLGSNIPESNVASQTSEASRLISKTYDRIPNTEDKISKTEDQRSKDFDENQRYAKARKKRQEKN